MIEAALLTNCPLSSQFLIELHLCCHTFDLGRDGTNILSASPSLTQIQLEI